MRFREDQIDIIFEQMRSDRAEELKVRLAERGKISDMQRADIRARIDRILDRATEAHIVDPHDCARLVELFFLLSPRARESATCASVVEAVLANKFLPSESRVAFLYRHVLTRTDWPD